jgi:hypothetical protein
MLDNQLNKFLFVSRYEMEVNFTPEPFYFSTHWIAFAMYTDTDKNTYTILEHTMHLTVKL